MSGREPLALLLPKHSSEGVTPSAPRQMRAMLPARLLVARGQCGGARVLLAVRTRPQGQIRQTHGPLIRRRNDRVVVGV